MRSMDIGRLKLWNCMCDLLTLALDFNLFQIFLYTDDIYMV